MPLENTQATRFLQELFRLTGGDGSVQVATQTVGAAIGLDKEAAGKLSEDLIGEGWVAIKTLSGGIGITAEGAAAVLAAGGQTVTGDAQPILGREPVLDSRGRAAVEALCDEIKKQLSSAQTPYAGLEEIVMDLKTLEIQMCSPRPKTAIAREILRSLSATLEKYGSAQTAKRLTAAIGQ